MGTESERSLGTIIKELTADISRLFRSEIALLKLEIRDTVVKLGTGSALLAVALCIAMAAMGVLTATVILALMLTGLPAWAATLIVGGAMLILAAILAVIGVKRFQSVQFVPTHSVEQIKTDIEAIKSDISRVRSR
ncbi:MAG TPA: phage holin family protein [Thermoanaerobaculia bacterium]|nr:phage holin family protein [Thermoanaerobaculia bacterium]